jgi:hypothetical protein
MNDPLDITRLLTGAAATVAKTFPEPLRMMLFMLSELVGLAVAVRDAGHDPVAKITEMRRAVEDFAAARRRVHDEVDAIVDATLAQPDVALRTPTNPFGHAAASDAAATPPEPADGAL